MKRTRFGQTGLEVSQLGFGGAPIGLLNTERQRSAAVLNQLLDAGVNLIDTAAGYEGSEEMIGDTVGHRRGEYVLVSKCGRKLPGLPGESWTAELIAASIDRSLRHLKTDVIDVMLLHSCDLDTLKRGEAVGALAAAREQGKIRFAGYSGDNAAAAYAVALPDVAVLETSVSIADQANLDTVLPGAVRHDVGVLAKRPLANAAWKDLSQQEGFYKTYAAVYTERLHAMKLDPASLGFTGPAEAAWPELAMRFTLGQAGVHCTIIGTTNPDNARRNVAYAGNGPLPPAARGRIRDLFREAEAGKTWEAQT